MFSLRLKLLRDQAKINQQTAADHMGLNRSTYAGYETGDREPDFNTLTLISKYFGVTTDYLLGLNDSKVNPYVLTADESEFVEKTLEVYRDLKKKL